MSSPIQSIANATQNGAANLAPIKPLLKLRDNASPRPEHPVQKAVQERWNHKYRLDQDVWREIYSVMQMTALFISGDQILRRNPVTGGWGVLPINNSTTSPRSINYMQFYASMLMAKDLLSNPDILISAGRNKDQCISAARAANAVNKFYENEWYTPDFARRQALFAITGGTYINRIRFDNSKESSVILTDVFEQKPVEMKGYGFCGDCQYTGGEGEFQSNQSMAAMAQRAAGGASDSPEMGALPQSQQCPNCGSMSVAVESGASQMLPSVTGQQRHSRGDLVCEQMPLFGCRFDLNKRIEDSSWAIYRQRVSLGSIRNVLGNVNLPQSSSTEHDVGLEMVEALAKAGQALYGSSGYTTDRKDEYKESVNFDEMWLSPEDYSDVVIQADEETLDGSILPKGKLTETFPDGLVAVGLNGMAVLLGLHAEKHKDHIVSGAWNKKMLSGVGRGIADTVEVQKRANILDTQRLDYITTIATPAVWYNKDIGDADKLKYLGSPHANIPFDMTKLPETAKLADVAYQFQPSQGLLGNMTEYIETFLNNGFAYTSAVTEFTGGLPGMAGSNDTATGAQLEQSTADTVNMPIFAEKADVRKRSTQITVRLYVNHFPESRTIQLTGKYGEQQSIDLKGSDLDTDLNYQVIKNSEIPTGPYQTRKNLNDMFVMAGGVEGYMMLVEQKPQMAAKIEQAFDVDLETDAFDDVAELCRKRLNQMKSVLEAGVEDPLALVGAMLDPMSGQMVAAPNGGAIQPPISMVEPNLKRKAQWFSDFLDTDEGQKSSMVLRKACELLAQGQIAYQTAQDSTLATAQGQVEVAGQAPAMQAQAAMQPPQQPDQSAQMQQQQQEAEGQQQAQQQIGNAVSQLAQNAHEAEQGDAQREHEASEAEKDRASKEKLAKLAVSARRAASNRGKAA
jgi:hypothetical protein